MLGGEGDHALLDRVGRRVGRPAVEVEPVDAAVGEVLGTSAVEVALGLCGRCRP
jgi:hypothetical protein